MTNYIKRLSDEPTFKQNGLNGFNYHTSCDKVSISYIDVYKGHEKYCSNIASYHIYYVIEGNGTFKIDDNLYEVSQNDIIEIPPNTKFVFKGNMKLLLIMNPPYSENNNVIGKENDLY